MNAAAKADVLDERFGGTLAASFDTFMLLCAELVRCGELTL